MVAVVKVAISNREQLATLRVKDDVLVLATMLWPDEIRQPDFGFLDDDIAVRPQELAMAEALVNSMATTFDPSHFRDEFHEALQEVLEAKMSGRAVSAAPATTDAAPVVDLMSALRASVDAAKAARTSSPAKPIRTRTRMAAAARKVPSKPVAAAKASKAAGKKAPAKRAPRKTA
jgi:DNA end-binding protein Ku